MKKETSTKKPTTTTKTVSTKRTIRKSNTGRPPRLYVRATFLSLRRGKTTQQEKHALLRIEGLNDRKEIPFYQGKRVVYIYKCSKGFRVSYIIYCN
jgi:ribosomal protein L35AE/L33A